MFIGIKAIEFSAGKAYDEEGGDQLSPVSIGLTIALSILLGIGLFVLLPLYATKLIGNFFPLVSTSSLMFNFVDGLIRVFLFILYIVGIGLWKEMRRIFEYHGAEHKVIHAYENGNELLVQNIKKYSPAASPLRHKLSPHRNDHKHIHVFLYPPGLAVPLQILFKTRPYSFDSRNLL